MIKNFGIVLVVFILTQSGGLAKAVTLDSTNGNSSQRSPNKMIESLTFTDTLAGWATWLGQTSRGPVVLGTSMTMPVYTAEGVIRGVEAVAAPHNRDRHGGLPTTGAVGALVQVSDDARGQHADQNPQRINPRDNLINIRDYGAVGNGVTNDASAFAKALAVLPDTGGAILFPPGYTYRLDSPAPARFVLSNKNNVTIFSYGPGARITVSTNTEFLTVREVSNLRIYGLSVLGTLSTDGFFGNETQGRIHLTACSQCDISFMRWENATQAVYINGLNSNIKIHHNEVIDGFNPIQTGGGVNITNANIWITDNYIQSSVAAAGADDAIALFSGPSGHYEISRNIIDKQGPTAVNFAHGILVDLDTSGTTSAQEVVIADNIIRNCLNTTALGPLVRAPIEVRGETPGTVSDVTVRGNILYNNNQGIVVTGPVHRLSVVGNIVDTTRPGAVGAPSPVGIYVEGVTVDSIDVSHNLVHNTATQGILVRNATRTKVESNLVTSAGNNGIEIDKVRGGSVSLNQVNHSTGGGNGVRLLDLTDFTVIGNSSIGNAGYGLILQNTMTRIKIIGNNWSDNGVGNYIDGSGSQTITLLGNEGVDSAPAMYNTAGTRLNMPHIVSGTARLVDGTAKVNLSRDAIYSSPDYSCAGTDRNRANAVKIVPDSANQFTITGTGTTDVSFICVGN